MLIKEAIEWLNPDSRNVKIDEIEQASGIDKTDIIIGKINEACRIAVEIMKDYLDLVIN